MSDDGFKVCPFCNERIEASLVNCAHCGRSLGDQRAAARSEGDTVAQATVKKRTGLAWLNGILLLLYGYGSGANILSGNFSRRGTGLMLALIFVGVILVAGCLFGFLAALNPAHEMKRKLAKYSNLVVVGVALFTLLRSIGPTIVSGFFLSAFVALPAVFNLRAFWKPVGNKGGERSANPAGSVLTGKND